MKIDFIISDTTKRATTSALKNLVKSAEENLYENFLVIVPETKSIIIEKELLSLSKTGAFLNVYIYSFVRLINKLGLISPEKIANKQTAILMLRKIIYNNLNNLVCYKKTAKSVGFAEKMYETIAQFKSSNILPCDLKSVLNTKSEALKQKLTDIVLIYEEYEKAMGEELFDDCDKLSLLIKYAKTSDFIKNSHIFVVGFDNITFEMQQVLTEFSKNSKSITFSSVYFNESRTDKYIQKNELFKKFTHIADSLKIPYTPVFYKTFSSGDFYNIQNFLYSTEKKVVSSNGNVCVFKSKNKDDEIEFVVNTILKEIKERNLRFRDIGVLASDVKSNKNIIEKTFKEYNIPYFINQDYDISSHFFVDFLKQIFSVYKQNFKAEEVLKLLSSELFGTKNYSCTYNFVLASGINYKGFLAELDSEKFAGFEGFEDVKLNIEKLQKFYDKFEKIINNSHKISEYLRFFDLVCEFFDINNKLIEVSKVQEQLKLFAESEVTKKVFEKVENYLKMMSNFLGETEVSFDEFVSELFSGIGTIKLNILPLSVDSVVVQENTDGFFGIKDLFIFDAVEGKFPVQIYDGGIISDAELEETKILSGKTVEPTVAQINSREEFRCFECFIEPTEKLFVSFSENDEVGNLNKPAMSVERLINLFDKKIVETTYEKFDFASLKSLEKDFAKNLGRFYSNDPEKHVPLEKLNNLYGKLAGRIDFSFKNYLENMFQNQDLFSLNDADELFFVGGKTSVSQLEKYFACPYQFFATYGLRLKENKLAKLSSLDVGNILHRVAELFIKKINNFANLDEKQFSEKVINLLNYVLEEANTSKERNKAILKLLANESVRLCRYMFYEQQNSSFKTSKNGTEFVFAGENGVKLNINNKSLITLEGKIDRIDEFGDYLRIIDYKTGDVSSELSSIYFGKKIQLVSYLSAISKLTSKKVAGLFYMPIHSDFVSVTKKIRNIYKFEGFLLDDIEIIKHMDNGLSFDRPESDFIHLKIKKNSKVINENKFEISGSSNKYLSELDFKNVESYIGELCKQAISEILSGNIEPSPIKAKQDGEIETCKYCKFAGFCGLEKAKFSEGRTLFAEVNKSSFELKQKEENNG